MAATPTMADPVLWEKQEKWNIITNTERNVCLAGTVYRLHDATQEIMISLVHGSGWEFSYRDERVTQMKAGEIYDITVNFGPSTKPATLSGVAIDGSQIRITNLTNDFVAQFVLGNYLEIEKMGRFPLAGSYKAVKSILDCFSQVVLGKEGVAL